LPWKPLAERTLNIHIEKPPEGVYLVTFDEISGLVAHWRTIAKTFEIDRDVARQLISAHSVGGVSPSTRP
jgi:predicted RNase H-like HicB family nuclease